MNNVQDPGRPLLVVRNRTWLMSDTHLGHQNIVRFQQRPINHEVIMLSNWIDRIGEDDVLLHLGDVFMGKQGNPKRWSKVIARMPGRKYVLMGNHDKDQKLLEAAGFTIIPEFEQDGVLFTHEPIRLEDERLLADFDWHTNVHGHTHGNVRDPEHDGYSVPGKRYVNVCVEHTKFVPIQYGTLRIKKEV